MDYKNKLQTNNTALEGNNLDLQTILDTINSLPEAGGGESVNFDDEITAQDVLISELSTILDNKVVGGSEVQYDTCKLNVNVTGGSYSMSVVFDMVVVKESVVECVSSINKYNVGTYDVLCDSVVKVYSNGIYVISSVIVDGYYLGDVYGHDAVYFQVPNENGATVQVDITLASPM